MRRTAFVLTTGLLLVGLASCDLLDPTNVENPDVRRETALNSANPLQRWTLGLERQLALVLNSTIPYTSIATDNYENTGTLFNDNADALELLSTDEAVETLFFDLNDLRESAAFGKRRVVAADEDPSPDNIAELDFFEGMAHLLLGEHFHAAPLDSAAAPVRSARQYEEAISLLQKAIDSGQGDQVAYHLAQARAYYNNGNLSAARRRARNVLNMDADYVRFVEFDNQNEPANVMQNALYDRSTEDDFQPLPRLDFLDPKYGVSGAEEDPIPLLKAEEAHLILIEAALAEGNLSEAKQEMRALLDLIQNEREPRTVDERTEGRLHESPEGRNPRPNSSEIEVRADPDSPFRSGLVLDRTEETVVPEVSGTSVTVSRVNALSTPDAAWELYYLLRQEIFMAEGRRFVTLNLTLPLPQTEQLLNPNVESGPATTAQIPEYVEALRETLDAYEWNRDTDQVTITVNVNRVLAENRSAVSPFLR